MAKSYEKLLKQERKYLAKIGLAEYVRRFSEWKCKWSKVVNYYEKRIAAVDAVLADHESDTNARESQINFADSA